MFLHKLGGINSFQAKVNLRLLSIRMLPVLPDCYMIASWHTLEESVSYNLPTNINKYGNRLTDKVIQFSQVQANCNKCYDMSVEGKSAGK